MNVKLALLTSALLAIGCNHVNAPIEGREDPYGTPQVTFADKSLRNATAIGQPRIQRDDAGNLPFVTLPIRSAVNRTITVDYKVTWYDRGGAVVYETGWMPKTLEANTAETISANATTDRAADFRIALRMAK